MAHTVIEKMARAIGAELYGFVDPNDTPNTWASAESAARAALIALRDGVGRETLIASGMLDAEAQVLAGSIFRDMLNHVLQDGEK